MAEVELLQNNIAGDSSDFFPTYFSPSLCYHVVFKSSMNLGYPRITRSCGAELR